ncbi:tape measure protein [Providencia sp. PROV195]|uniref:tape measure protein n=1 Tax=Providencia sp. PROV195 TaxID=2949896 RepID=UPI00234BD07E|nr:tape measure protein [Providencia sp. PROV195]
MTEQTSRLAIILDSTGAKRNSDTLATSLERLTMQGEKATGSTDELGFSFKRLATSAAGALSIGVVIKTVDEWGQVAARIKNALKSVEGDIKSYSAIQERFLAISNRNGKNIEDVQLLYIGAASSMQELGYNTTQTIDYIESLSSSMTANASSVNEVLSMQNALNKSMVAGRVAGENWNSIMNATPTLLGDIAKQLEKQNGGIKVTEMEVKKLAADGKISFKLFADAVMAAKDANNALADSMDNTVADGLTRVTNSAKAYYGELNQSLGLTRAVSASLATVSDNFGSVSTVLTSIVGIGAARYFGNLSNSIYDSTKKAAENALTNRKLAVDKVNAARATLIQAQNERAAAIAAIESTKAQQAAATTEVQRISLKTQLANQTAVLTTATKAETVATNELALAKGRANIAGNLLKGTISLIGGPVGFAMLAAGGIYTLSNSLEEGKTKAREFSSELPELISNLEKLNKVQAEAAKVKLTQNIRQLKEDISDTETEIKNLENILSKTQELRDKSFFNKDQQLSKEEIELTEQLTLKRAELDSTNTKLGYSEDSLGKVNSFLTLKTVEQMQATRQQQEAMQSTEPTVKMLADAQSFLAQKLGISTNAMKQFNAQSLLLNYGGDDANKFIQGLKQQVELSEKAGKARAQLAAEQAAMRAGANPEGIKEAIRLAGIEYDNLEKQRELTKSKNATYSESAAQKMLSSLKEQQMVLIQQRDTNGSLGSQQQALVKWEQQLADIKSKKTLTADQKSLLANAELITLEMKRNAEIEKAIQRKEAEVKIAAYNKQLMEETAQAQRAYNIELQGAGIGNLARSRLQERLRLEEEYQKKHAALTAQYNDASSGITQEMYEKETQIIKGELDKRILMMQGYHAEQDALRENWQMGIKESLLNYIDEATNYNQIAADSVTNILNSTTSAISAGFTDMINGTKSVGDAFSDMASGMGQAVIQQLTQMAAQWLVYQAVQMMVSKTTQSSASAGLTANAQAASQMAGLNAYASTAAIPIFGPAMAPAAMAAAITATQPLALTISALSTAGLTGMAHSGIDKVPQTGTWLLEKGERVMTQNTSARLDKMLEDLSKSMTPDQYAMKNIHPANQTTNNSNQESMTQNNITVHSAPITIQGNPDNKTIALIEQSQKKAIKEAIDVAAAQIIKGDGRLGNAMRGKYSGRKLD